MIKEKKQVQRIYYHCQSDKTWNENKQEFESELKDLRKIKDELLTKKSSLLSPRSLNFKRSKNTEEIYAFLALKEEENSTLSKLLNNEKAKSKELSITLKKEALLIKNLESKLLKAQSSLEEKEKIMTSFLNGMASIKNSTKKFLKPRNIDLIHSSLLIDMPSQGKKQNDHSENASEKEMGVIKEKEREELEYIIKEKEEKIETQKEFYEKEIEVLKKQLADMKELYQITARSLDSNSYKILVETNELLQEQIKNYEQERIELLSENQKISKNLAEEFCNLVLHELNDLETGEKSKAKFFDFLIENRNKIEVTST